MLDFGFYNMDCMDGMKQFPDKFFELAIVDPPYGIGDRLVDGAGKDVIGKYKKDYYEKRWDVKPDKSYFDELFRVSRNQIIWGGNYFDLPPTRGIIAWDKKQMMPTFSRWEYAWTSFDKPTKMFEGISGEKGRFHPTQKPIALYEWLLTNYAHKGDKILDTHVGSASSLIACEKLGFKYHGFEIDADYYKAAQERIAKFKSQVSIFDLDESLPRFEQKSMEV